MLSVVPSSCSRGDFFFSKKKQKRTLKKEAAEKVAQKNSELENIFSNSLFFIANL